MKKENVVFTQGAPLVLTVVIFLLLSTFIYLEISVLNIFSKTDIVLKLQVTDILVGLTIYLKTSVDFAIFIGNLMAAYPGWKNRIAIEIGTAFGNALGTIMILAIWNFFRDIEWLLAIMIFIAALVLLELAEEGLTHVKDAEKTLPDWFIQVVNKFDKMLHFINGITGKFLRFVIPKVSMKTKKNLAFTGLFAMSFSVPFILGLDDFAGYVPVFNIVNVFGFAVGVLAGHMVLNIFLFISPSRTIRAVKNPVISFLGSMAFVALALWGLYEVYRILFLH